jgi:predicted GNAT family acetyltransferase
MPYPRLIEFRGNRLSLPRSRLLTLARMILYWGCSGRKATAPQGRTRLQRSSQAAKEGFSVHLALRIPAKFTVGALLESLFRGYTQYVLLRGRIAFLHTEVYESFEGMGLGGRLARLALDDARQGTGGSAILPIHCGLHRAPPR